LQIEVSTIGPHQRFHLWIDGHFLEYLKIKQGTVQFARKNRLQIDDLLCIVGKLYP
jgi:hypothetical protein